MKKEQKYFERIIDGSCWQESNKQFQKLLADGWKIVIAIPINSEQSYTSEIHYVLEREIEDNK